MDGTVCWLDDEVCQLGFIEKSLNKFCNFSQLANLSKNNEVTDVVNAHS